MALTQISGYARLRFTDPESSASENPKTKTLRIPGTVELLTPDMETDVKAVALAIADCISPTVSSYEFVTVSTF